MENQRRDPGVRDPGPFYHGGKANLKAGDLLYLPRGYLHSATTSDTYSAHVTIGVSVYTWADLVKELLQTCVDDADLRRALPPGW